MITLMILFTIAFVVLMVGIGALVLGGSTFIIMFSDLIVAGLFIWWICKKIIQHKKKN